jgi:hypothetical protein
MKRTKGSCPVAALAREVRRLEDECSAADDAGNAAKSEMVYKQVMATRIAISHLTPKSKTGALCQVDLIKFFADDARDPKAALTALHAIERMTGAVSEFLAG